MKYEGSIGGIEHFELIFIGDVAGDPDQHSVMLIQIKIGVLAINIKVEVPSRKSQ